VEKIAKGLDFGSVGAYNLSRAKANDLAKLSVGSLNKMPRF
jgi:hypothetical protein